jgi:hypothetical protein
MIANGDAAPLEKIPYVDYPELRINKNESTEMPFRYVKGENGESIMPEVCSKAENLWWNVLTSKGNDRVNQERFRKGFWGFILSGRVASTLNLERSRLVVFLIGQTLQYVPKSFRPSACTEIFRFEQLVPTISISKGLMVWVGPI